MLFLHRSRGELVRINTTERVKWNVFFLTGSVVTVYGGETVK